MVHVAVIGLRGIPHVMGGIESHCAYLLPRLIRTAPSGALKITVLGRSGYIPKSSRHDGVDQIALWAPAHPAFETILHTILAIIYARFVLRADCIHLHAIGPGLAAPLARLLGMPVLFTHHGEDYRRRKWGRSAAFEKRPHLRRLPAPQMGPFLESRAPAGRMARSALITTRHHRLARHRPPA